MQRKIVYTRRVFAAVLIAAAAAFGSACTSWIPIQTNDREVLYERGTLATNLVCSLDSAQKAVVAAVKDLNYDLISMQEDALGGHYEAQTDNGDKVVIRLVRNTPNSTAIDIHVGLVGNEKVSHKVLDAVMKKL